MQSAGKAMGRSVLRRPSGEVLAEKATFELNFCGQVGFDWHLGRRTIISKNTEMQNCFLFLGLGRSAEITVE